jgi:NAD(P)-dependent dehydrogenase (short-subunit alcohol dehydrogenase family)
MRITWLHPSARAGTLQGKNVLGFEANAPCTGQPMEQNYERREDVNMETLEGKVILVTGGARGLGEAICKRLYAAGAHVIAADIREDLVNQLAAGLETNGRRVRPLILDVSAESQVERAMRQVAEEFGSLDVLINNAGTDKTLSVDELDVADWDRVISVNLRGPFVTSKYAFPIMREQGGGQIVNIVSTAAKRAWANAAAYHASKWGLLGFSHALHVEGRPYNIKVTAVVAGGMRTPFLLDRFPDIDLETLQDPMNVAETVQFVLTQPKETVIPEIMVLPMRETSWP